MASVKVAVRVRPFNSRERNLESSLVVNMVQNQVSLLPYLADIKPGQLGERGKPHNFAFDHAYWSHDPGDANFTTQEQVFMDLGQDVVKNAFDGYNVCVFAYGQTGSGKTYTMMGSENDRGLIPRICATMFNRMKAGKEEGTSYRTEVSYLEIYNERVKDLLKKNSTHNLKVREHPSQGPYVQDLSKHLVVENRDLLRLMEEGNNLRTTASTNMNDTSSRSHAIFTITFVQAGYLEGMPHETLSKIHLVDLAGSERANATGATGQRLKEGAHINKSLVTLGSVISALAEAGSKQQNTSKQHFIPYRDSVLTWLLKDSLGGNSKTIMIATISPADVNHNETLSTLRYANRAKNIINKPTVNEDANVKLIRELREEIDRLKAVMSGDPLILEKVQEQLAQKEAKEQKLTAEWNEKWREAAKILQEHNALGLKRTGLGVMLDSDKPHLIGLDEDILSTGITLYQLRDGDTQIGNHEADQTPHILLKGPSILPLHCTIRLEGGVATLLPAPDSLCLVNASPVDAPVRLSQGCVIVLGKTNMFRYNDPLEAADMRKSMTENSRRVSLMNQSLMSQSLSDLRNPANGGNRTSGEWRMFSSDSDIKDIAESEVEEGGSLVLTGDLQQPDGGSGESINTIKNPSGSNTAQGTPRNQPGSAQADEQAQEEKCESPQGTTNTDENANPTVYRNSTPLPGGVSTTQHHPDGSFIQSLESRPFRSSSPLDPSERSPGTSYDSSSMQTSSQASSRDNRPALAGGSDDGGASDKYLGGDATGGGGSSMGASGSELGAAVMQCSSSTVHSEGPEALGLLYQEICDQKDVIMACLEEDKCDIEQLNSEIAKLQAMQHRYSLMEFESTKSFLLSQQGGSDDLGFLQDRFSQLIDAEVDRRLEAEANLRAEKEMQEREFLLLQKEKELERLRVAHEREMYLMKKKLSSTTAPQFNPVNRDCGIKLLIPRFYPAGVGKQTYIEYEVGVLFVDSGQQYIVHRRYRQFRDLHTNMCSRYGSAVQFLQFPAKKIFGSKTEAVSSERQRDLSTYLNRLVSVCCKLPGSPLYRTQTRDSLETFSAFFQSNLLADS